VIFIAGLHISCFYQQCVSDYPLTLYALYVRASDRVFSYKVSVLYLLVTSSVAMAKLCNTFIMYFDVNNWSMPPPATNHQYFVKFNGVFTEWSELEYE